MNWCLVIQLLAILGIKLIGTTLFLLYYCEITWVPFGGKCYFFSAQEKNWDSSRKDCTQANADLAVVNSKEELTFLMGRTENANYYIGLTKKGSSGRWKWIDNTKFDQKIFDVPHRDGRDCAVVGVSSTGSEACSVTNRWICEKDT